MADKPIIQIPIDTSQFDRFKATFDKYQDELKAQPEKWAEVDEGIATAAATAAAMAESIGNQVSETQRAIEEEKRRDDALKDAEKRRRDEAREREKRDEAEAKRRQKAIQQVKDFARETANMALTMGKWAIGGGALGFATGALGMFGLDRLVSGFADERRLASGMGVSIGQRQGMGINMQRYFDVNSVMSNVAAMQNDPSSWGKFAMAGINPRSGADPAQMTLQMADAARRMFQRNPILAQQMFQGVFGADDLRRLGTLSNQEWAGAKSDARAFAKQAQASDAVGAKWQKFLIGIDTATAALQDKLVTKLSTMEPDLEKIIKGFADLASSALDNKALWKALGDGVEALAKYIGSKDFVSDLKTFGENVSLIAQKTVDALRWFGIIPGSQSDTANQGQDPNGIKGAVVGGVIGGVAGGPLGAIGGAAVGGLVSKGLSYIEGNLHGNEQIHSRFRYAAKTLQGFGWGQDQTKGIAANIYAESQFNPMAVGDSGKAYGIAQWHADRQANYASLFGHTMQSVKDPQVALKEQVEFLNWEMTSKDNRNHLKSAGDALRATRNAYEAGSVVSQQYERPKDRMGEAQRRGQAATRIDLRITNQTGTSVATTANAAAGG